ncbi:MAG: hypothetical protein IKY91_00550 [Akkermansia sp.]|nr:hypothetical protein [Akkermansia sp.]
MPTVEEVRAAMPRVGDHIIRKPHMTKDMSDRAPRPQKCVVDYVNEEHLWYRVQFANGTRECYKAPELTPRRPGVVQ